MAGINDSFLVDLQHSGDFSNDSKGDLKTISGLDNLKQSIYNRLITVKGTIVHRPEYGVGLKLYQGVMSTLSNQRDLALKIREQLLEDTRIESIDGVKFDVDSDLQAGNFIVTIQVTATGVGSFSQTINPFGE